MFSSSKKGKDEVAYILTFEEKKVFLGTSISSKIMKEFFSSWDSTTKLTITGGSKRVFSSEEYILPSRPCSNISANIPYRSDLYICLAVWGFAFNIPYLELITLETYNPVSGVTNFVQAVPNPKDSATNFKPSSQEAENYDFLTMSNSAYFLNNHIDPRYKFNPQNLSELGVAKVVLIQNPDIERSGVKPEINPPGFDLQTTRISGYEGGCQVVFGANPVTSASGPSRNLQQVPVKFFTNPLTNIQTNQNCYYHLDS